MHQYYHSHPFIWILTLEQLSLQLQLHDNLKKNRRLLYSNMGPDQAYQEAQHRMVFSTSRDPHLCGCSCCKVEVDAFLAFKIPRLCSGRLPRLLLTIQLVACNAATPLG